MRSLVARLALAVFAALFAVFPASAQGTGTPAWSTAGLTLYEGPGNAYDVLGEIEEATRLRVDQCTGLWCRVHMGSKRGWVSRASLSFGTQPTRLGVNPDYKSGGPGRVCLYEGRGYSGDYVCATSGTVVRDLLLFDLDDRYSSVTIEGNVSITLCRDRNFGSYCERVNGSMPALHGFLDNRVSSYRVH